FPTRRSSDLCEAATEGFKRSGNLREAALALVNLGASARYLGDPGLAALRLEEALAISRKLGFQEEIAAALLMRQEPRQAVSTLAATDRRLQHPAQARREP